MSSSNPNISYERSRAAATLLRLHEGAVVFDHTRNPSQRPAAPSPSMPRLTDAASTFRIEQPRPILESTANTNHAQAAVATRPVPPPAAISQVAPINAVRPIVDPSAHASFSRIAPTAPIDNASLTKQGAPQSRTLSVAASSASHAAFNARMIPAEQVIQDSVFTAPHGVPTCATPINTVSSTVGIGNYASINPVARTASRNLPYRKPATTAYPRIASAPISDAMLVRSRVHATAARKRRRFLMAMRSRRIVKRSAPMNVIPYAVGTLAAAQPNCVAQRASSGWVNGTFQSPGGTHCTCMQGPQPVRAPTNVCPGAASHGVSAPAVGALQGKVGPVAPMNVVPSVVDTGAAPPLNRAAQVTPSKWMSPQSVDTVAAPPLNPPAQVKPGNWTSPQSQGATDTRNSYATGPHSTQAASKVHPGAFDQVARVPRAGAPQGTAGPLVPMNVVRPAGGTAASALPSCVTKVTTMGLASGLSQDAREVQGRYAAETSQVHTASGGCNIQEIQQTHNTSAPPPQGIERSAVPTRSGQGIPFAHPGVSIPRAASTVTHLSAARSTASVVGQNESSTPNAELQILTRYTKRITYGQGRVCPFISGPRNGRIFHIQRGWVCDPSKFTSPLCKPKTNQRNCNCAERNCREIRANCALFAWRVEGLPLRDVEALWQIPRATVHQRLTAVLNGNEMHIYHVLN